MALETTLRAGLKATKGSSTIPVETGTVQAQITATNPGAIQNIQIISTVGTTLNLGGVALPGFLFLKNEDTVSTISVSLTAGAASNGSFAFLRPGEPCVIPTRQTTFYALANPSSARLLVAACEV